MNRCLARTAEYYPGRDNPERLRRFLAQGMAATTVAVTIAPAHTQECLICTPKYSRRASMPELAFRDGVMDRIRLREPRFNERAYLFVLGALEYHQQRLPERRHISGRELALACRDLALERFGVMSRMVLEHWGVRSTADFGEIVFVLVELELLMSQATDTRDEFIDVFEFSSTFERDYPWCAQLA